MDWKIVESMQRQLNELEGKAAAAHELIENDRLLLEAVAVTVAELRFENHRLGTLLVNLGSDNTEGIETGELKQYCQQMSYDDSPVRSRLLTLIEAPIEPLVA